MGGLLQQSGTSNQFSYAKALNLLFSQDNVWSGKLNMFYPILMITIFLLVAETSSKEMLLNVVVEEFRD